MVRDVSRFLKWGHLTHFRGIEFRGVGVTLGLRTLPFQG